LSHFPSNQSDRRTFDGFSTPSAMRHNLPPPFGLPPSSLPRFFFPGYHAFVATTECSTMSACLACDFFLLFPTCREFTRLLATIPPVVFFFFYFSFFFPVFFFFFVVLPSPPPPPLASLIPLPSRCSPSLFIAYAFALVPPRDDPNCTAPQLFRSLPLRLRRFFHFSRRSLWNQILFRRFQPLPLPAPPCPPLVGLFLCFFFLFFFSFCFLDRRFYILPPPPQQRI